MSWWFFIGNDSPREDCHELFATQSLFRVQF
jgi:hypothetical protein